MKNKPKTICNICGHGYGRWRYHYTTSSGEHVCRPCGDRENLRCQVDCIVVEHSAPVPQNSITALRELRVERETCEYWLERTLGRTVNYLRSLFPGAPDRLLWRVVLHDPHYGDMGRHQLRHIAKLRRRLKRLQKKRARK